MTKEEAVSELYRLEMELEQQVNSGMTPARDDFIFMMNRKINILSTICKLLVQEKEALK